MGNFFSGLNPKETLFCETHVRKEASAFCFTHKKSICMTCILKNDHFTTDCTIKELDEMVSGIKDCLFMKQEIIKANEQIAKAAVERKMEQTIDNAYSAALANLHKLKQDTYWIAREKIIQVRSQGYENSIDFCKSLDKAVECFNQGRTREAKRLKEYVMMKDVCYKLEFETIEPEYIEQEQSLMKVKEITTNYPKQQTKVQYFPINKERRSGRLALDYTVDGSEEAKY